MDRNKVPETSSIFKNGMATGLRKGSKTEKNRQSMGSTTYQRNSSASAANNSSTSNQKAAASYLNTSLSHIHASGASNQKNRSASRTSGHSATGSNSIMNQSGSNFNVIHSKLYEQQQVI